MNKLLLLFLGNVNSQMLGGIMDSNNCLIGAGYSYCESSDSCIRQWVTPCEDNYKDCNDCLNKQRKGINIACPDECDMVQVEPECPEVMCMMYCANGYIQDDNGCDTCRCNDPMIAVDPIRVVDPVPPTIMEPPVPPTIMDPPVPPTIMEPPVPLTGQMATYYRCNSDCQNCDIDNTRIVMGDCKNKDNQVLVNNLCQGEMSSCDIPYEDCDNEYVCPKITEVTRCGNNGLDGYSTYRLSLIVKNNDVKNIYAVYGSDENNEMRPLILPPAYQSIVNFNSNIGGVLPAIINIDSDAQYDSWLTIGITDGNMNNEIMSVGIDFDSWTETSGITITNGAVFTFDPDENIVTGDEYIIGQITIPNGRSTDVTVNVQGKTNCVNCVPDNREWDEDGIVFNIHPPINNNINEIPRGCSTWYDGCNTCQVNNGIIGGCTRMMCFRENPSYCINFEGSGH
jgi:hypothetical protein